MANDLDRLYALCDASQRMGDGYAARLRAINEQIQKLERAADNSGR